MCTQPKWFFHPDGAQYGKVNGSCGRCKQCVQQVLDDIVGRCLAEGAFSDWVCAVTLTYRDSDERAGDYAHRVLTPSHFQKWIRALRDSQHTVRYLGAGEYGDLNGRSHFHAILFGQGPKPDWPSNRKHRWHMKLWPHGFVTTEFTRDPKALRYVAKYYRKTGRQDGWSTLSKKPPLGHAFFMAKAERDFALGVIPSTWAYTPPGADRRRYLMTGTTRRNYLMRLAELGGVDVTALADRSSEWVTASVDKVERELARNRKPDDPKVALEEYLDALKIQLDLTRPQNCRIEILETAFRREGEWRIVRNSSGGNPTEVWWPGDDEIDAMREKTDV